MQATNNQQPTTNNQQPTTNNQQPTTNNQQPTTNMIDVEQVRKVAHLARLELAPGEEEQFATQLSSILEYFEQLSQLDTKEVQPTTRAIEINNVTRGDELESGSDREALLGEAPQRDDDFFRVPQILSSEEE